MLTKDWFSHTLGRAGLAFDTPDKDQFLESHSFAFSERSTQSETLLKDRIFRLSKRPICDTNIGFYRANDPTEEDIFNPANIILHEFFDSQLVNFVQTAPVAIDPSKGVYKLLTPISGTSDVVVFSGLSFDQETAMNEFIFGQALSNPISKYKKDDIEITTRSLLDEAEKYQNMQARSGATVIQVNCTRYSDGLVKGKRDDI
jgi:hypothetical protein